MKKLLVAAGIILIVVNRVQAQGMSSGIALRLPVDSNITDGSVVCVEDGGLDVCENQYALNMYGVVTDSPVAAFESMDGDDGRYVVSSGRVFVRVTEKNGPIKVGDLLTSSSVPGVAEKATDNGYVLGSVMGEFIPGDQVDGLGKVELLLNIRLHTGLSSARSNLIEYLKQGIEAPLFEPLASLRYVLAALLILLSFVLGFVYFGKMARSGIEAIGRNPLASKMIQLQVIFNVTVLIVVIVAGLFAAYLVLIL